MILGLIGQVKAALEDQKQIHSKSTDNAYLQSYQSAVSVATASDLRLLQIIELQQQLLEAQQKQIDELSQKIKG